MIMKKFLSYFLAAALSLSGCGYNKEIHYQKDSKPAVLVIDMQPYFLSNTRSNIASAQCSVIDYCAKKDVPVVNIEFAGCGDILESIQMSISKVPRNKRIVKDCRDGFYCSQSLDYTLKSWGVNKLYLMGVFADRCVKETAEGAIGRGYKINSSLDLIAPFDSNYKYDFYKNNGRLFENYEKLLEELGSNTKEDFCDIEFNFEFWPFSIRPSKLKPEL